MPRLLLRSCAVLVAALAAFATALPAASELSTASSTFLRAYADSPVKWQAWGDAAFARAKAENKPVFLLIGTATNELTRAMHRQTFANPEAAALLNDTFVCVLVDAKEQPELTALYQNYLAAVKQLKGLPMSLWLTPELKPFDGANYLPPTEEWGKEGFLTVAKRAAAGWKADAAAQRAKADEAVATLVASQALPPPDAITAADLATLLKDAAEAWNVRADATNGGFGDPPKYVEPELLRFLLRQPATRETAVATLKAVGAGAIHDPLDGGFFRYATDPAWTLPYLQKNAADQARIALAFLDAAQTADEPSFKDGARSALNYLLDRLTSPDGELATSEDATPDELASHYFWTLADLNDTLGSSAAAFAAAYSVTEAGNLAPDAIAGQNTAGKNALHRTTPLGDVAAENALAASAGKLLARRDQHAKPLRDELATSGTHGLALAALARAGAELKDARFAAAAKTQVVFLRAHLLTPTGELRRLADSATIASAQDYAFVAAGLAAYQSATSDATAGKLAADLIAKANATLLDAAAGRYLAATEQPATGLWAKVFAAEATAGDTPAAEPAMLLALSSSAAPADKLAASIAADAKAAAEIARGDQLLSLSSLQR